MSLLKRLLGKSDPPKVRVRVCVECGCPWPCTKATAPFTSSTPTSTLSSPPSLRRPRVAAAASHVVAEHQFLRVRREVHLRGEVLHVVRANVVT